MKTNNNKYTMVAKTFHGLEGVLAAELKEIGAENIQKLKRAVKFSGDKELMYKSNLMLRTAVRILKPVHMFRVQNEKQLYLRSKEAKWNELISPDMTIAISATVNSPNFNHANFAALKVKDAIVDKIRNKEGARPYIDRVDPDINLHVHISMEDCEIYLDSSGDSLHKRGWRTGQAEAPLSEILAAGMVKLSGWDGNEDFLDPMCGSGTLCIEAAMQAANIPPGINREFAFMKWPDFDKKLWNRVLNEAKAAIKEPVCRIYGRDISSKALNITRDNAAKAGVDRFVNVSKRDFFDEHPENFEGNIVINPPYGERIEIEDLVGFYRNIGDSLKQYHKGSTAWVLCSDKQAIKNVGLKPSQKMVLFNGKLECRFHKFELY
ncbi:MAG: class I SAM-dependent RNA methyltransferase [Candidatus Kapaibacterium sp.]